MRGICACAMFGVVLALPPGLQADEAAASGKPSPPPATGTPQESRPAAPPLFLKSSRIYLGRTTAANARDGAAPALDLEFKSADVQWMLKQMQYKPEGENPATVEVTGELDTSGPDIPGGPFALFWAMKNLKQAWRIFTPIQ